MKKIKFFTDENIAPTVIEALRNQGYDVKDVKEKGLFGVADAEVRKLAKKDKRIILTCDKDFADLLRHPLEAHCGVVLLRYSNQKPEHVAKSLLSSLPILEKKIKGRVVILSDKYIKML